MPQIRFKGFLHFGNDKGDNGKLIINQWWRRRPIASPYMVLENKLTDIVM
jgi:hypothetical protein